METKRIEVNPVVPGQDSNDPALVLAEGHLTRLQQFKQPGFIVPLPFDTDTSSTHLPPN